MLEPKTIDWSDIRSDSGYESQLENLKKITSCLDTTKQYSENASTSEEGSSVASPFISSSSKFSSHYKSIRENINQIRNLYGPVVYLNVFDLTADITGADFIQFYDPIRIDSIIKYPTSTMLDLEFCCKEDAIRAIEKGVGMINGCLFSVRISKRNYNPNVSRQNERYNTFYNKRDFDVVTYTKKTEVPEIKVEEVVAPSLQTITENNLEETLHKILSIEISQSETEPEESSVSQQETAKTFDVITNDVSLTNSPQISVQSNLIKSMNLTSPQPNKTLGKEMRTPPTKVGKYRNIVRSENKTQSTTTTSTYQPSAEEMEKVNKLQKQLIDQFLQEKQTLEKIQKEKEEKERLEREEKEKEEARIKAVEEEESVKAEEKAKEEEEASKPVRKEVYEKIIYQQSAWRDDYRNDYRDYRDDRYYRDDGYYRGNRYGGYDNGYDNYNSRYSSRPSSYRFATVEREYTARKNF